MEHDFWRQGIHIVARHRHQSGHDGHCSEVLLLLCRVNCHLILVQFWLLNTQLEPTVLAHTDTACCYRPDNAELDPRPQYHLLLLLLWHVGEELGDSPFPTAHNILYPLSTAHSPSGRLLPDALHLLVSTRLEAVEGFVARVGEVNLSRPPLTPPPHAQTRTHADTRCMTELPRWCRHLRQL